MAGLSRMQRIEVACPGCGRAVPVGVWRIADAGEDPELRATARAGRLNETLCLECGRRFIAPVAVLYLDATSELAVAYVPETPFVSPPEAVGELILHVLEQHPDEVPPDYLLDPPVYVDDRAFAAHIREPAACETLRFDHTDIDEACAWVMHVGDEDVLEILELLLSIADREEFIELLNDRPALLESDCVLGIERAALQAEREGEPSTAEVLGDIAALLRIHTPLFAEDVPPEVTEWTPEADEAEADLAAVKDAFWHPQVGEPPEPGEEAEPSEPSSTQTHDDARRASDVLLDPDQREGSREHAVLFGGLVDEMLRRDNEAFAPMPDLPIPDGVPLEQLTALLGALSHDEVEDQLERHPLLRTTAVQDVLRRLWQHASDIGEDSLVNHLEMILGELELAELEDEDPTGASEE